MSEENGENRVWFWEERRYRAPHGGVVVERVTQGDVPEKFPRFVGIAPVTVDLPNGQRASRDMQFEIEADSPMEAFEQFQSAYDAKRPKEAHKLQQDILNQMQARQQKQQKIVTPNQIRDRQ